MGPFYERPAVYGFVEPLLEGLDERPWRKDPTEDEGKSDHGMRRKRAFIFRRLFCSKSIH